MIVQVADDRDYCQIHERQAKILEKSTKNNSQVLYIII